MLPLQGLVVLDFSTLLPGPYASLLLSEAGAEVIRIERPEGEDMRRFPPMAGTMSAPFAALNRGKERVTLDLKSPDMRDVLDPLIARADILIEQFRPGVMARLGLGYDTLAKANPRLIYCSISGYGQTGPRAGEAGHDMNYQARSGLLDQHIGPGPDVTLPLPLVADIAGGSHGAVINILLALRERDRTGQGCHLDISMTDGTLPFAWLALAQGDGSGTTPRGGQGLLNGGSPRYALYRTQDGAMFAVAALEDKFWRVFCAALDLPLALRDDQADPAATRQAIADIIAARPAREWQSELEPRDCCCTVVRTLDEALADPHLAGRDLRELFAEMPDGRAIPAAPLPLAPHFRRRLPARRPVR
jgi:crotonobetainyl-CoA:carnitine CoA-transferase CaiB-like acyl-CoA transferase